ncbi:beta-galactosidase trimerization domain-containing protein [Pseudonocardia alaniniphila]|uniref:Cellulase family glycosylhydrolase n=1 Tax=Pseudonocardia alaniniphila TaxID=75291 RepID=A0ABS9TF40_9PSEU|nr:beta-galactosidase trimerization domain-containing protein [Pseudonocardia alaniniphila]MCH6167154.1 cellulase family glycosylhydrolase [Pseudonocardia alaniniphila]
MSFTVCDGRLLRDDRPFLVQGVDYHPSSAGCRIWTEWDPGAIAHDFERMAEAGLNTVRFFVFWRDFEPEPGCIDMDMLERLRHVVDTAAQAKLACVISLFTIWMNGQLLDLPWRQGRSLWRDEDMLALEEKFATAVAREVGGCDNVLAFDLGDEIGCVDPVEAAASTAEQIADWQARLAAVLRLEAPNVLVLQANDASGVLGPSPFGADNSAALDLIGIHGFPVWAPGSIESTLSFKATNLTSFLVRFASAYGVPLVDELGSYGVDDATAAAYLRASAASAIGNGASGILVWCWQDIAAEAEPYADRPMERFAGLHRLDGSAKPVMREYRRIIGAATELATRRPRPSVAVYLPQRVRAHSGSYLDSGTATLATFFSYLLLKRAHIEFDIVADDLTGYDLVICPSVAHVTLLDLRKLHAVCARGGTVYFSLGDHIHGFPGEPMVGAEIVDYAPPSAGKSAFSWDSDEWTIDWAATRTRTTTLRPTTAEVIGRYLDGSPGLLQRRVGNGRFLFTNAPFEAQLDRPERLTAAPWERFYRRIAALAGVAPVAACPDPDVEILSDDRDGCRRLVLINHGVTPSDTEISWGGATARVELTTKDWTIVHVRPEEADR